eukprot:6046302-Lingulodinium_polyedra.AAC.1
MCEAVQLTEMGLLVSSASWKVKQEDYDSDEVLGMAGQIESAARRLWAAVQEDAFAQEARELGTGLIDYYYYYLAAQAA